MKRSEGGARPDWHPVSAGWWILAAIMAVGVTTAVVTTWLLAIAGHAAPGTALASARLDAVRTGLAAGGGAAAAVGLMLAFRRQHHQEIATVLTDLDATERRITELYFKATEQLGSDKAPVRLGGLYALERLAQDNPAHRQTIVNVICAYLRMPFAPSPPGNQASAANEATIADGPGDRPPDARASPGMSSGAAGEANAWDQEKQVRLTAQRILGDHMRYDEDSERRTAAASNISSWLGLRLDLTGATLINFDFASRSVKNARFDEATFAGDCTFSAAFFKGHTGFNAATFTGMADFRNAWFASEGTSIFAGAKFNGRALFDEATFGTTWFLMATFADGATFVHAKFTRYAVFVSAKFNGRADFSDAIFANEPDFGVANFEHGVEGLNVGAQVPSDARPCPPGWRIVPHGLGGHVLVPDHETARSPEEAPG